MNITNAIKELGFSGFVHLNKTKRDGKERKIKFGYIGNDSYTVILLLDNENWVIEKLSSDDDLLQKKLNSITNIESLFNWLYQNQ